MAENHNAFDDTHLFDLGGFDGSFDDVPYSNDHSLASSGSDGAGDDFSFGFDLPLRFDDLPATPQAAQPFQFVSSPAAVVDCAGEKSACLPFRCPFVACQLVANDLSSYIAHLQSHQDSDSASTEKRSHERAFRSSALNAVVPTPTMVPRSAAPFSVAFVQEPPTEPSEWLSMMAFEPAVACTVVNTSTGLPALGLDLSKVRLVWRLFDAHNNEITHDGVMQGHEALFAISDTASDGGAVGAPWQPAVQQGMAVARFPEMRINYHCSCRSPLIITQHYHLMCEARSTDGAESTIASSFVRDSYPDGPLSRVQIKVRRLKPEWREAALGPFADHSACTPCHCCEGGGKKPARGKKVKLQ